ncbi:MAG: OmpA family protein [Paludibacteraceae bacterium]|nr:OmpA family protein [Paludibacteraceae bacterium]
MKKLMLFIGAVLFSSAMQAIERRFADDYTIAQSRISTSKEESGLSLLNGKLSFNRNDTIYVAELNDSFDIKKVVPMLDLSNLGIEGQFAQLGSIIIYSNKGELYQVEQTSKGWGHPQKLKMEGLGGGRTDVVGTSFAIRRWTYKVPVVKGLYNPAVSKNGKRLYFSAEIKDGFGGRDIWYSERKSDGRTWSAPINLGETINTTANEDYPFIAGDSVLYFASAIDDTLKGMNIFKAWLKNNSKPQIISADFNSDGDDENFVVVNECPFLVSNRGGNMDIYRPEKLRPNVAEISSVDIVVRDTTPINVVKKDYRTYVFYFDYNKTSLIDSYEAELNYIYEFVSGNPESRFTINGHTDTRGSVKYNLQLSTKRAKIVYDKLIQMGVDKKRLKYSGFGKSQPDIKNAATEEDHQKNRRVEIIKLD